VDGGHQLLHASIVVRDLALERMENAFAAVINVAVGLGYVMGIKMHFVAVALVDQCSGNVWIGLQEKRRSTPPITGCPEGDEKLRIAGGRADVTPSLAFVRS